ncbi:MAG: hypothetical protein U0903_21240 [Planctomycetales bacterium]
MVFQSTLPQAHATIPSRHSLETWECAGFAPGSILHPDLLADAAGWVPAVVPGTVAHALQQAGRWSFEQPRDIDSQDWWYRSTFSLMPDLLGTPCELCFDGLATLAEVWLNGEKILTTDNMFRGFRIEVGQKLQAENELAICFRSVSEDLKRKRPRPRWKTNLVNHQQLRWIRTSLQGRIPGWSPVAPGIGPWREVRLESSVLRVQSCHLLPSLAGNEGRVSLRAVVRSETPPDLAKLRVGTETTRLELAPLDDAWLLTGELRIANPALWFPHTHGTPALYDCELQIESLGLVHTHSCSPVGFRTIAVPDFDKFSLQVNGRPIYCRGACWTVSDLISLTGTEQSLRHDLTLARDAGINMLRVGGTMVYECDLFYRLCDELGILVWQDFMFANMDYPVADAGFRDNLTAEVTQQLTRLAAHPSVAVYCGSSEIEQQAAMLGLPRELWRNDWFATTLPALCAEHHPGTPYLPSTPCGGVLPFHTHTGVTHYYGIGAYLRSPAELRRDDVKFTAEALGFSNLPDDETANLVLQGRRPVLHDPEWKRRVPRDTGAGWDFEDVRDHYLQELYGVDPAKLRSWDMAKYLQLSRLVPGEMMTRAFSEWRSTHTHNRGGLVWFYKDLWPGAGWGIVDARGLPKATYYYLKRIWQSRQLTLTDEGLNGIHLHATNETDAHCDGHLEVVLLKEPNIIVAKQERAVSIPPHSQATWSAEEILGGFHDVSYAYRFGPPSHDVVIATWYDGQRNVLSEAVHLLRKDVPQVLAGGELKCSAHAISDTEYEVLLGSDQFLHGLELKAAGYLPSDNYFHLRPGRTKSVTFRSLSPIPQPFRPELQALNLPHSVSIPVDPSPPQKGSDVYPHS